MTTGVGRKMSWELAEGLTRGEGWCPKCRTWQPVGDFPVDRSRKFGYATKCSACDRESAKRYYCQTREGKAEELRRARKRAEAVYGAACVQCGWTKNLQFDHVNGDGAEHRAWEDQATMIRRIGRTGRLTDYELQLLCPNCHAAKTWPEVA